MQLSIGDILVTYISGDTDVETVQEIFTRKTWDGCKGIEYYITDQLNYRGMPTPKKCRGYVCTELVRDGKWYNFKTGEEIKVRNGKTPIAHERNPNAPYDWGYTRIHV